MKDNSGMRPYQQSAYVDAMNFFAHGGKSALVVLPTGLGKTVVIASIAGKVAENGGKVLLLAHRTSLVEQLAEEVSSWTGEDVGVFEGSKGKVPEAKIVASTVQSMANATASEKFGPKHFALVCVDETHHIPADTYQKIVSYFSYAKLLGVTATPRRGDRTDVSKLFEKTVSEYTLSSAIRDGWLSPIVVQTCNVNLDVRNVEESSGDYSVTGIGGVLAPVLRNVALEIKEKAKSRKTIVFVPLVSTAVGMAEIFKQIGMSADWVAGERKDSEEVMKAYREGEFQVLINSMLLTEGYNEPGISCVVNLRLTRSLSLATQILGRGTRLSPGKEDLLVLDFLWQDKAGRHHLNAKATVALASGEIEEEEIPYFAEACAEDADTAPRSVFDGIESARSRAKDIREEKLAKALAHEEEKAESMKEVSEFIFDYQEHMRYIVEMAKCGKRACLEKESSKYKWWSVFANEDYDYDRDDKIPVIESKDKGLIAIGCEYYSTYGTSAFGDWITEEPTDTQMAAIKRFGIPAECIACKGHASFILDVLYRRAAVLLCSYKQACVFSRYSFVDFNTLTRKKATAGIDMLKKSGWRMTPALRDMLGGIAARMSVVKEGLPIGDDGDVEIG